MILFLNNLMNYIADLAIAILVMIAIASIVVFLKIFQSDLSDRD